MTDEENMSSFYAVRLMILLDRISEDGIYIPINQHSAELLAQIRASINVNHWLKAYN